MWMRASEPPPTWRERAGFLEDAINPGFFGELPAKVATFLAGVGAGVVLVSR